MSRPPLIEPAVLTAWISAHPHWRIEDNRLIGEFSLSYNNGLEVLAMVRDNVDEYDHHPRATVEYRKLTIELWTHDRNGITELDTGLAELFSRAVSVVSS